MFYVSSKEKITWNYISDVIHLTTRKGEDLTQIKLRTFDSYSKRYEYADVMIKCDYKFAQKGMRIAMFDCGCKITIFHNLPRIQFWVEADKIILSQPPVEERPIETNKYYTDSKKQPSEMDVMRECAEDFDNIDLTQGADDLGL